MKVNTLLIPLILLITLILIGNTYAQNDVKPLNQDKRDQEQIDREAFYKQFRQQMEADRKEMEKFFKSGFIQKFEDMMKGFNQDFFRGFDDMMKDDQLGDFFKDMQLGGTNIEHVWKENKDERILVIKIATMDNSPFDIKIENGMVIVNGTVEKRVERKSQGATTLSSRIYRFNKSYPIPADVDPASVRFDKSAEEVMIIFTKKGKTAVKPRPRALPKAKPPRERRQQKRDDREAIPLNSDDVTI